MTNCKRADIPDMFRSSTHYHRVCRTHRLTCYCAGDIWHEDVINQALYQGRVKENSWIGVYFAPLHFLNSRRVSLFSASPHDASG